MKPNKLQLVAGMALAGLVACNEQGQEADVDAMDMAVVEKGGFDYTDMAMVPYRDLPEPDIAQLQGFTLSALEEVFQAIEDGDQKALLEAGASEEEACVNGAEVINGVMRALNEAVEINEGKLQCLYKDKCYYDLQGEVIISVREAEEFDGIVGDFYLYDYPSEEGKAVTHNFEFTANGGLRYSQFEGREYRGEQSSDLICPQYQEMIGYWLSDYRNFMRDHLLRDDFRDPRKP